MNPTPSPNRITPVPRTRIPASTLTLTLSLTLTLTLTLAVSLPAPAQAITVFVAPNGTDTAPGTESAPLRSIPAALAKSRTRTPDSPATLVLASGRYELTETLTLGPEDSGLTITAAPGAHPVLSGGLRLTGWTEDPSKPGLWRVTHPDLRNQSWNFQQLFVDGRRAQRARTPNTDFLRTTGRLGTNSLIEVPFRPGDIQPSWTNLPHARLVMLMKWTDLQVPIRAVDTSRNVALLPGGPRPYWMDEPNARYWIENVPEALDAPDEWYLDTATGVLSYLAPNGLNPNNAIVVAPRLTTLVSVQGHPATLKAARNIAFQGITFSETDYMARADGWISPQAAMPIEASIGLHFTTRSRFEQCTFENLGGYALQLGRGAQDCEIRHCTIRGSAAGGIRVGEPNERQPDDFTACRGHKITDNRLHQLGRVFAPAVGIIVFQSGRNHIAHNEIHDLYYTAISVGWNWGYQETPCRDNLIEFNHLHHIGQGRLSDMGGVYTLGIQQGTIVRNNLIHDVTSYDYGGWGLYTDEGSTGILLESNVVYHCKSSGFHQHYGRDNTVRHNVFAFNRENQLMRTRDEDHTSFHFTNNIVYFDSGKLLGSSWRNNRFVIDRNLYFDLRAGTDPSRMDFAGGSWDAWKARGHDTHSLVADPRFVDPASRDFRLKPESPAFGLGFHPPDVRNVGPRPVPDPSRR
jgi:hypothetical protein